MYLRRGFPLCTQSTQLREVTTFLHTCLHLQYTTRSLILTCRQSVVEQEDGGIRDVQFLKTGHCGHIHRYVCGTCINIFKKTTDDLDSRLFLLHNYGNASGDLEIRGKSFLFYFLRQDIDP